MGRILSTKRRGSINKAVKYLRQSYISRLIEVTGELSNQERDHATNYQRKPNGAKQEVVEI